MKKLTCLILSIALLLCLGACKETPEEPVIEETPAPAECVLEREGNPSTGYQWFVSVADATILKAEIRNGQAVAEPSVTVNSGASGSNAPFGVGAAPSESASSPVVGAPVKYSVVLIGQKEGETVVRLDYKRSGEETEQDLHEAYKALVSSKDGQLVVTLTEYQEPATPPAPTVDPEQTNKPVADEPGERRYCVYSMVSDGMELDLSVIALVGIDPMSMYVVLKEDGTGEVSFQQEEGDAPTPIQWTDAELIAEGEAVPYEITDEGRLVLSIGDEKMVFAPAAEVEAAMNALTGDGSGLLTDLIGEIAEGEAQKDGEG